MKPGKPSVTARFVAQVRASLERPEIPTGDATAELRLYQSLGSTPIRETQDFRDRMERRTRFFDRLTVAAIEGGVPQVVIVGAGYDGRPVRFASPGVTWYEVDHPSTQADKRERLLAARADVAAVRFVPIDLVEGDLDAALEAAGHERSWPTLFLVEGLLVYLPRPVADRLLRVLRQRSAPAAGSRPPSRRHRREARPRTNSGSGHANAWSWPWANHGSTSTPRRRWTSRSPPADGRRRSFTTRRSATRVRPASSSWASRQPPCLPRSERVELPVNGRLLPSVSAGSASRARGYGVADVRAPPPSATDAAGGRWPSPTAPGSVVTATLLAPRPPLRPRRRR